MGSLKSSGHEYSKESDRPALVISTIEAPTVLIGLKLFYGDRADGNHTQVQMIPSFTDNRGNGLALDKLMTNRYRSSAVVMELDLKRMSVKAVAEWTPRTANHEADELANGIKTRLDPAKRIDFKASELQWDILPEVLSRGLEMERESQRARALPGGLPGRTRKPRKRKLEDKMRVRDPWSSLEEKRASHVLSW